MYAYIAENIVYKQNCDEILFDWYNLLFLIKTGCEIKIIETQSDVIWDLFNWKT